MKLREFSRRVESDLLDFEKSIRRQRPEGKGQHLDMDYEDWMELFVEHTIQGTTKP